MPRCIMKKLSVYATKGKACAIFECLVSISGTDPTNIAIKTKRTGCATGITLTKANAARKQIAMWVRNIIVL